MVFYGDIYVHILDGTNLGRIVEAMILVVFSFLDYLVCFISVAEMDCLKDRRYAAAKESGEFYKVSVQAFGLFVPYILWVMFATYLNIGVAILN